MTRRVAESGRISLATFPYHVGAWLAGETVDVVTDDRLVQIFHRGVLVATHARRHPLEATPAAGRSEEASASGAAPAQAGEWSGCRSSARWTRTAT